MSQRVRFNLKAKILKFFYAFSTKETNYKLKQIEQDSKLVLLLAINQD